MLRIGVDTGGTFTDFVVVDGDRVSTFKLPSTPAEPEKAVLEGLSRIVGQADGFLLQHGSTVATNTLLERKGAKTLLVTNEGFEDLLEIGRQNRPRLYQLSASRPKPLIGSNYRLGIKERTLHTGQPLVSLEKKSLDWLRNKVKQLNPEAVAVVLLYSYLKPENEKQIAEALQFAGIPVSLSHEILPEFREFERTSATVVNAYLRPILSKYLSALSSDALVQRGKLTIMQSNGGSISAEAAHAAPVRTLLSGPAGGVVGAFEPAREAGYERIITFDMGGTSTDVCLCSGTVATTNEAVIDHMPVPIPMIGIHTIGAGGGSIAWIDSGGLLRVGPQSAGADPGPACYGKGEEVTVTDANLFLGRIDPDYFLGGTMKLSPERIGAPLESLAAKLSQFTGKSWEASEIADGIIRIVNTQMERAVQLISLQRGYDTRDFTLVSFGGSGGLHACDLTRALLIPRVLIPPNPGLLSALGILRADVVKDTSLTVMVPSREPDFWSRLQDTLQPLRDQVQAQLEQEGFPREEILLDQSVDARYIGQSYELNVPFAEDLIDRFHRSHHQFYGYSNPNLSVEIVNVRVRGAGRYPPVLVPRFPLQSDESHREAMIQEKRVIFNGQAVPTRFFIRERLEPGNQISGPAVILEYSATTLIPSDFKLRVDEWRNLVIEPAPELPEL